MYEWNNALGRHSGTAGLFSSETFYLPLPFGTLLQTCSLSDSSRRISSAHTFSITSMENNKSEVLGSHGQKYLCSD